MLFKSHFVFVLKIHISFLQATTFRFADYMSFLNINVTTPAVTSISAKSLTNEGISDIY